MGWRERIALEIQRMDYVRVSDMELMFIVDVFFYGKFYLQTCLVHLLGKKRSSI